MLLNLTNHPAARWSEPQLKAAKKQFGSVQDMQFPNVPPSATYSDIQAMVETYIDKIKALPKPLTVHLAGEFTFTFQIADRLRGLDIPCVASTSERNIIIEEDGTKTIRFKFVQFRNYY